MKKLGLLVLTLILGISMTLTPVFAEEELSAAEGSAFEGLDGMTVEEIQNDPELSFLLDDPTFYRYYEVTDRGVIQEKEVDLDEVDEFIARMDANAEGIDDDELIEVNGDMTAMGGGVSGLGKGQIPAKYSKCSRYHCVDISWWQGKVSAANWQKVRAAGVTHAIIRCGYSGLSSGAHSMDSTFANNIIGAYNAGIKVGVYYYSTAVNAQEALSEAQYVAAVLKNYKSKLSLPVAFDYETGGRLTANVMKANGTASCIAFCDYLKSAGYTPMVYANYTTLTNYVDYRTLQSKYRIWLANYTTNGVATTYPGEYWMWQYSSSGRVNGLSGNIDINYIFNNGQGGSAAFAPAPAAQKGYKAILTSDMNYRVGPGTNYKKKGMYRQGTAVYMVGTKGDWAKLTNGYYVKRSSVKYIAQVQTKVNLRTGPGTNYKKAGICKKGTMVTIIKVKNGWAKLSSGKWLKASNTHMQKW